MGKAGIVRPHALNHSSRTMTGLSEDKTERPEFCYDIWILEKRHIFYNDEEMKFLAVIFPMMNKELSEQETTELLFGLPSLPPPIFKVPLTFAIL